MGWGEEGGEVLRHHLLRPQPAEAREVVEHVGQGQVLAGAEHLEEGWRRWRRKSGGGRGVEVEEWRRRRRRRKRKCRDREVEVFSNSLLRVVSRVDRSASGGDGGYKKAKRTSLENTSKKH